MLEDGLMVGSVFNCESSGFIHNNGGIYSRVQYDSGQGSRTPLLVIFALISVLITGYFFLLFNDYRKVIQKHLIISEEEKVKQQIVLGENLYCEFKSSLRWGLQGRGAQQGS